MQGRHCARLDSPLESVAHDEIVAFANLANERRNCGPIVRVIRIGHQYDFAPGLVNPAQQRGAVALSALVYDAGAETRGNFNRAVSGAVVRHNDLASNPELAESLKGLLNADCEG